MAKALDANTGPFMLLVQMNIAPEHEVEYNRWCYHHVPKLLEIPGWQLGLRHINVFGDVKYLQLYVVESLDAMRRVVGPHDNSLDPRAFAERTIFEAIPGKSDMRVGVYEQLSGSPLTGPFLNHDHYLSLVMADVKDSATEEEWNRWYDHSHLPNLTRVPGYLSGARFRTVSLPDYGQPAAAGPKYLAMYEWEGAHCVPNLTNPDTMIPQARAELQQWIDYGAPMAENTSFNVFRPIARHRPFLQS